MKNEFASSAGLATCSRGKVLGLNYGSDSLTTVLQTLKQSKEEKREDSLCLVFLKQ